MIHTENVICGFDVGCETQRDQRGDATYSHLRGGDASTGEESECVNLRRSTGGQPEVNQRSETVIVTCRRSHLHPSIHPSRCRTEDGRVQARVCVRVGVRVCVCVPPCRVCPRASASCPILSADEKKTRHDKTLSLCSTLLLKGQFAFIDQTLSSALCVPLGSSGYTGLCI